MKMIRPKHEVGDNVRFEDWTRDGVEERGMVLAITPNKLALTDKNGCVRWIVVANVWEEENDN